MYSLLADMAETIGRESANANESASVCVTIVSRILGTRLASLSVAVERSLQAVGCVCILASIQWRVDAAACCVQVSQNSDQCTTANISL